MAANRGGMSRPETVQPATVNTARPSPPRETMQPATVNRPASQPQRSTYGPSCSGGKAANSWPGASRGGKV